LGGDGRGARERERRNTQLSPSRLYRLSGEGWYVNEAYATAVVLIVLVLALNFLAELIAGKLNKKLQGEK